MSIRIPQKADIDTQNAFKDVAEELQSLDELRTAIRDLKQQVEGQQRRLDTASPTPTLTQLGDTSIVGDLRVDGSLNVRGDVDAPQILDGLVVATPAETGGASAAQRVVEVHGSLAVLNSLSAETIRCRNLHAMTPMGEISYFNLTGTAITISAQSDGLTNMVVAAPATTFSDISGEFDNGGSNNGRLRYTGMTVKNFHIAVTFSFSPATASDKFVFAVARDGTIISSSRIVSTLTATIDNGSAIHSFIDLAPNQYIELYVGNVTAARNCTVKSLNLFAMGMGR